MPTRGRQTVVVKLLHSPSICGKQFLTFWDEQLSSYIIFNQLLLHSPHRFFSICTISISLCTVHAIVSFALLLLCSSSFEVHKTQIILMVNWCLKALSAQKAYIMSGWPFSRQCEIPWQLPGGSRNSSAALGMLSVTHIMPTLVLLSVVGVGMQQYMIRNHILNI